MADIESGFLPENPEYSEVMHAGQEDVEKEPKRFIIEECLPACYELWSKNIYTYMVSDSLNTGEVWIEINLDNLSEDNKQIIQGIAGDNPLAYGYHDNTVKIIVNGVGYDAQAKLLELAKQFKLQDVPHGEAYLTEEEFLTNVCNCVEEFDNPDYYYMDPPEAKQDLSGMEYLDYFNKYYEWLDSNHSQEKITRYDPNKVTKPIEEYAQEKGMIYENGRVYLSNFHYQKHLKYLTYCNENNIDINNTETKYNI